LGDGVADFWPYFANAIFAGKIPNFVPLADVKTSEKHASNDVHGGQYSATIVPNARKRVSILVRPACEADDAEILRGQRGSQFSVQNSPFLHVDDTKALGQTSVGAN
jgi:hypothetical protein